MLHQQPVTPHRYLPRTLHGTAIYATPLTRQATPTDRHSMAVPWSVWDRYLLKHTLSGVSCPRAVSSSSTRHAERGVREQAAVHDEGEDSRLPGLQS